MVFSTPEHPPTADSGTADKTPSTGLLGSVTALAALFARKAGRVTRRLTTKPSPRSPMARPKQMLKTISQSAMTLIHKKKIARDGGGDGDGGTMKEAEDEQLWGHGGVWQRGILMGDKCQPLDFSGAIYYDSNGNKMDELPLRSPRASPLPGYLLRKTAV